MHSFAWRAPRFQNGGPSLEQCMANMTIQAQEDSGAPAQGRIAATQASIQKVLDCQTFIVSLFNSGTLLHLGRDHHHQQKKQKHMPVQSTWTTRAE